MSQVEELQTRILNLPAEDFSKLRDWFLQLEDEIWEQKISEDFKAGKFNKLIEELWSVRVGKHYRAIGIDAPDGIQWIWIGSHSEYDKFIN